MATTYNLAITRNPNFNTVLGLTNTVFDRNNVRSGRMATEDQIQQLWQDIISLEERIDYCCRDIVFWDFRVRIRDRYGNIVSDYLQNRTTGITRRGKNFTIKLPIKAVPKYEVNIFDIGSGLTPPSANWENEDITACVKDSTDNTPINGLCSLLYRGNSGEYYEMSQRKTTPYLGFAVPSLGNNLGTGSFVSHEVDVNGSSESVNGIRENYMGQNKMFAYTDGDDIYIDVLKPIDTFAYATGTKSYGRIYYLDVRDVTL